MKNHKLKTWPKYFYRVMVEQKRFEIRKNDRDFEVNDTLTLEEWDPETKESTGRACNVQVDYILLGGQFGIEPDYVVMSISRL